MPCASIAALPLPPSQKRLEIQRAIGGKHSERLRPVPSHSTDPHCPIGDCLVHGMYNIHTRRLLLCPCCSASLARLFPMRVGALCGSKYSSHSLSSTVLASWAVRSSPPLTPVLFPVAASTVECCELREQRAPSMTSARRFASPPRRSPASPLQRVSSLGTPPRALTL